MYQIQVGSTNQTVYLHLKDSTTGLAKTGLVYNSAGAICRYVRPRAVATAITLATLANASASHSDGGFIEVDATNAKGLYRLDLPDAPLASGATFAIITIQFTGVAETALLINLTPVPVAVADIFNYTIEGSYTFIQILRGIISALAGRSTGGGTTSPAFRDLANTKNRISMTVDSNGNRTASTLDLT